MNQTLERLEEVTASNAIMVVEEMADVQNIETESDQAFHTGNADIQNWRRAGRHALMNTRKLVQKREQAGLYMRTAPARDKGAERLAHMRRAPR